MDRYNCLLSTRVAVVLWKKLLSEKEIQHRLEVKCLTALSYYVLNWQVFKNYVCGGSETFSFCLSFFSNVWYLSKLCVCSLHSSAWNCFVDFLHHKMAGRKTFLVSFVETADTYKKSQFKNKECEFHCHEFLLVAFVDNYVLCYHCTRLHFDIVKQPEALVNSCM